MSSKKAPKTPRPSRVNRSISFTSATYEYVKALSKEKDRSFNWIVNDLIAKHGDKVTR